MLGIQFEMQLWLRVSVMKDGTVWHSPVAVLLHPYVVVRKITALRNSEALPPP